MHKIRQQHSWSYLTLVTCAHVLITFFQITISLIINTGLLVIQYGTINSLILYQAVHFHVIYMHTFLTMTTGIKIKADKKICYKAGQEPPLCLIFH